MALSAAFLASSFSVVRQGALKVGLITIERSKLKCDKLIPLASVIPPATLSVSSAPTTPPQSAIKYVPNIDFVNLNYVNNMASLTFNPSSEHPNQPVELFYSGPSRAVENIVQVVAAERSIMTLTPPGPNTSWTLEFTGPALHCSNVADAFWSAI